MSWLVLGTWKFSLPGVTEAGRVLEEGGNCIDAVEMVVRSVESDETVDTVGLSGVPNDAGEVELDAAIMSGRELLLGAVAGVRGYAHPVTLARKVMTDSPHNMLVGEGAEEFAREIGLREEPRYRESRKTSSGETRPEGGESRGHDTVGAIAVDAIGDIACAVSSSGLAGKHRGRVGDAPLVGSGFYADNEVGAAVATGVGEEIMRSCLCSQVIELIRRGAAPEEAATEAVRRAQLRFTASTETAGKMAVLCVDFRRGCSAAANHRGFEYIVAGDGREPRVIQVEQI
jgi:N4-(beta-N-acetylglucosaminyl)-L-asparaginase